jgi:DNA-binding transcriptional MerR regulator
MAKIDDKAPIIPLSSVADILNIKPRTLRMYEEKGLLPKYEELDKKLYSLNDIKVIEIVHYLVAVMRVNANGVRYILSIYYNIFSQEERDKLSLEAEEALRDKSFDEVTL